MKKVLVPVTNGTEEMEAIIIIDMLRRAKFQVLVAGTDNILTCSRGTKILADDLIENIKEDEIFDAVILPGGQPGTDNLIKNQHLASILINHSKQKKIIAAICAAPLILVKHNIIEQNQSITAHFSVKDFLKDFDYVDTPVVVTENIITSQGAGTAFEFVHELISRLSDENTALKIKRAIMLNK